MQVFSKMAREEQYLFLDVASDDSSSNVYYKQFSKFVMSEDISVKDPSSNATIIKYADYLKTPDILHKCRLADLKATVNALSTKSYRVHKHGNKRELVERIESYFDKWTKALRIQRQFRRFLSTSALQLRGPAYNHLSKCVNDSDFFTMDPLNEINRLHFYSYADAKGFIYGFDVFSLMNLFKRDRRIINPYNRDELSVPLICDIFSLFKKIHILYPESCTEKQLHIPKEIAPKQNTPPVVETREHIIHRKLSEIRGWSVERRIEEVFIAIDHLGNYSQSTWFMDLSKFEYARFYHSYHEWWNRLSSSAKSDICYIRNPFSDIRMRPINEVEREEYQEACLELIEYMVYTGKDIESQRLGALHVLTQLTTVSYYARRALPWLFESVEGIYGRYR